NAVLAQFIRRANARQFEQVRRVDDAGTENHLFACLQNFPCPVWRLTADFHPGGGLVVKTDAGDADIAHHGQIGARQHIVQKGIRAVGAWTIGRLRDLEEAAAFLLRAIEIIIQWQPSFTAGLYKRVADRKADVGIHHIHAALITVPCIGTALLAFRVAEPGQYAGVIPTRVAQCRPVIVVAGMAAGVDHGIHRTGTAQGPAAGPEETPVARAWFWFGVVAPV